MTGGMGSHHSAAAGTHVWLTPPHVVDALGPFDLDPCASTDRPWDTAAKHYTEHDAPANSGAPSALVAYGHRATLRLRDSGLPGSITTGWHPRAIVMGWNQAA